MAKDDSKLHIAMFPWLALGHMNPFLELAKLIAQKGHMVSFISTPRNIDRLPKLPPHLCSLISFVKLPLPYLENLPQDAEATTDLPVEHIWYLKKAYDLLQEPLSSFLQSCVPDCVLYDFAAYWVPCIARKLNIPSVYFSIFTASVNCYVSPASGDEDYRREVEDYTVTPKWVPFPSTVAYRFFEVSKIFSGITGNESDISDFYRFREAIRRCELIAVRSCPEIEQEWLELLEQLHQKPVFPVSVLPPSTSDTDDTSWPPIKDWLDKRDKGSVVYIAFGSEAKPSQQELDAIAMGLELSEMAFFWVLRKRRGLVDAELVELPQGFEERTKGRGVVCTNWAPQLKILAHDSIGGFFTHGGWSSVVEALQFSKPLIILTCFADQGINAKLFQEKMIGYVIPRNEEDGSFTSNSVAESLTMVVVEEAGKVYRDKAMEMRGLLEDKSRQDGYIDKFLCYLKLLKNGN
ncbi:hypothetical protein K2173_025864 [Erythroxylum novogranatense]|uniref:Glycosyltransferase N-terminal domain-containing protein n=1 Tax=Erythroxylum novogranatense TaxID=1862640 RepID=A0AAV8TYB7_9ROSI|nr:hypothetical protein K2173_025864 [Erythroxylum novogranatense]